MIQLHMNTEDYAYTSQHFKSHMQPSDSPTLALSGQYWNWHVRRKTIFNREAWLFIEEESLFTICFFELNSRDIKQLDLTLWLRLISEYAFMSQKQSLGRHIPISDEFLTITRSWMAPMKILELPSTAIDEYANTLFEKLQQFQQRPFPLPIPIQYEMEFGWDINNFQFPTSYNKPVQLQQELKARRRIFYGTAYEHLGSVLEEMEVDPRQLNDIEIMDLIHRHNKMCSELITPIFLFTGRIALMAHNLSPISNIIEFPGGG